MKITRLLELQHEKEQMMQTSFWCFFILTITTLGMIFYLPHISDTMQYYMATYIVTLFKDLVLLSGFAMVILYFIVSKIEVEVIKESE